MRCDQVRRYILDQTLGSQPIPSQGPLYDHVQGCADCHLFLTHLLEVEAALCRLPLYAAPAGLTRRILAEAVTFRHQEEEPFLPWTLWLPLLSLFVGISWAYLAFLAKQNEGPIVSFPAVRDLLIRVQEWVTAQMATITTVAIAIAAGLLFMLLAIGLGLYVGRARPAIS